MSIPYVRGRVATQAHVAVPEGTVEEEYARPLRPRLFALDRSTPGDYLASRTAVLANADCRIDIAALREPMPYFFRNADGDELLFVHAGAGRIETDFGPLSYEPGDYLVIPRGTLYRLAPTRDTRLLVIETTGELSLPDRGMLGQHALFDPAVREERARGGPAWLSPRRVEGGDPAARSADVGVLSAQPMRCRRLEGNAERLAAQRA
jgi:homogentisate 1,2-dioxygenase